MSDFKAKMYQIQFQGRTVRQIWTNESSKRVVPLKEAPFGGLNDVSLSFGGKISQKLKFWGRDHMIKSRNRYAP